MSENVNNNDKMSSIDNFELKDVNNGSLMGVRDFINSELNERILPYIYSEKLMFAESSHIYDEYLAIGAEADSLLERRSENSSQESINEQIRNLYKRLLTLTKEVSELEKKSNDNSLENLGHYGK